MPPAIAPVGLENFLFANNKNIIIAFIGDRKYMKTYIISENMKFVSNPLGGILQYTCLSTDHTADFFNVNMSF